LQEEGICFSCYNFSTGDIFPDEGLIFYEDEKVRCQFENIGAEKVYMCTICDGKRNHLHFQLLPRLKGETIGYINFVREEGIIMDYHETVELYKLRLKENIK